MGKQSGQAQGATRPSCTDGCYAVPIRFLYGTAAEINFWDVIYHQIHEGGGEFDISTKELVELMGLSRQMVGRMRQKAVERGELIEDISWASGHRFVLRLPNFAKLAKGHIWKPLGYVGNGWHHVVSPAIPRRVMNLYLQQPRQRVYRLDPGYIAAKCKRRYLYGKARSVAPLNLADVGKALRLLVRLGLLLPDGDGFRIGWETFNGPAPTDGPSFEAPDPREQPIFTELAAVDSQRAERALELLDTGHYDPEIHLMDIFRDLAYVRRDDYVLLKAKVYRHRNRPPGPNRWQDTWRAFQYELRRRVSEIRGPKSLLYLGDTTFLDSPLTLDLDQDTGCVLAVRMVSRVEWPWYFEQADPCTSAVRLELRSGDKVLFARAVGPSDAEVRYSFHPKEWCALGASFTLAAYCDRPLPDVRVEGWLEARLRR
ncbi:MAG: hypothetical protein GY832_41210 [Chloroflexi bacterium]|nr:hypothetical protein [Chloroflexota bacterium]